MVAIEWIEKEPGIKWGIVKDWPQKNHKTEYFILKEDSKGLLTLELNPKISENPMTQEFKDMDELNGYLDKVLKRLSQISLSSVD